MAKRLSGQTLPFSPGWLGKEAGSDVLINRVTGEGGAGASAGAARRRA